MVCTQNRPRNPFAAAAAIALCGLSPAGRAAAPLVYHQAAYQSPVRGEPDDLLLIAGYGFAGADQVVYRSLDAAAKLTHPAAVPPHSTGDLGLAEVVSYSNIPNALTVRLPKEMRERQQYALWVVTADGEWSHAALINDARPLWATPSFVYSSESMASMPRYIKVVGRNLEPSPGAVTEIRLSGPALWVLKAVPATADAAAVDRYVARAPLPGALASGAYRIEVRRDGFDWIELTGQTLEVRPDPPPPREFKVSDAAFGGCRPDDGADDVGCVRAAIAAAAKAGGGTVIFGSGTWSLSRRTTGKRGIVLPSGVNLRGAGRLDTVVRQEDDAEPAPPDATFTLLGHNVIEGITFRDEHVYSTAIDSTFFRLGEPQSEVGAIAEPKAIEDVVITRNLFDRPSVAISDGGAPIRRLFITDNEFGAYRAALELAGNRYLVNQKFGLEDAIITGNLFKPGSYLDTRIRQGAIASEIGASLRVDFSGNTADGASMDRLYTPADARGWRAAFFWHMNNNQEMMLVAQNSATCTGDKDGDGEAISYDNNANTFGLDGAETVLRASPDSVTIAGPLVRRQNDRDIRISNYYQGHWVQVGGGPGLGQARKIASYIEDASDGTVTLRIAPVWDVVPAAGSSRVTIGREYWQVVTVANTVDHRKPLCQKSNRSKPDGGVIGMWAQTADSAIEGNRQYDTDGIIFSQYYNAEQSSCSECKRETGYVSFLDIRGNLIDGEYAWSDDCSSSGIFGSVAAGPTLSVPATVGYGLSISHNTINRADGRGGAAISLVPTWHQGPPPHRWPLVDNAIVDHNVLTGLDAAPARSCPGTAGHERTGISLATSALVWHSVLYANSCAGARRSILVREDDVTRVCRAAEPSCECREGRRP